MAPTNIKPWKAEYAKSGRSHCRTCKLPIHKETFRLGEMVHSSNFDGYMPMWNHGSCILRKGKQIMSVDDVYGIESLRWEDQQRVRMYVEGGGRQASQGSPRKVAVPRMECAIEVSPHSRTTCKKCSVKIKKEEVRISSKFVGQAPRGLAWHHAHCFMALHPSIEVEKLSGLENLSASDREAVQALVKAPSAAKNGSDKEASRSGTKRKKDAGVEQPSKVSKTEGDMSSSRAATSRIPNDLQSKLEFQSKELWALKDDLKKHVSTAELRKMLDANGQDSTGSELKLRDKCADGMIFGALGSCPGCSTPLHYSGSLYRCYGYLSAWSKCTYSTPEPERVKGEWKIPEATKNQFLQKWFKAQKSSKPVRILPPPSDTGQLHSSKSENLGDLKVAIVGLAKKSVEEWKVKIEDRWTGSQDDLKSKVKMLEALQDIEIASRLVGFGIDSGESLDDKYEKLHCDIASIPHESEDYQLIEKYLQNTHAPTHMDWHLELEEVFSLNREGEVDKFVPYREKLQNRMLLWHGSRLTNFVGILSQGLRIAPPEAPATGYMFGKGIYFADLVSKSAQYCFTDRNNPVGLMLLSEVALGDVYELKNSKYMDKPPEGKHSTKGLGKKVPKESEFAKWKNDVTVPCGRPVDSNVEASELMYNEYIVYNTAQVKMQFLLKVRFHHKR